MGIQWYTWVYKGIQGFTWLYKGLQAYTRVYMGIHWYLTIIPRARMGSESWAIDSEPMRARGIIVLVKSN